METSDVTGAPAPLLRLEDFLPYRLNVLAAMVSEGLAKAYSERFGLDIPGWRVLATLGQFGDVTAKHIGSHSHMHKTKVSRAVVELEARGLIHRAINPGDKREAIIGLTPQGRAVYVEIIPLALAYQNAVLAAFPPQERAALDAALSRLTEQLAQTNIQPALPDRNAAR